MDMEIRRIMVPLDGSELAERALPVAAALARRLRAELLLVRAVEPHRPAPPGILASVALRVKESDREAALPYLEGLRQDLAPVYARTLVLEGSPRPVLAEAAGTREVDLVVLSSHGRSGAGRWLLGSVAESLLRQVECPVLLVRRESEGEFRRVVAPLDGSPGSLAALPLVAALAAPGAEITLLRCLEDPSEREEAERELAELDLPELWVGHKTVEASPAEGILDEAASGRADLIAMSSHGRSGWQRWFLGSVAEKVARHAECPVLVVKRSAE